MVVARFFDDQFLYYTGLQKERLSERDWALVVREDLFHVHPIEFKVIDQPQQKLFRHKVVFAEQEDKCLLSDVCRFE